MVRYLTPYIAKDLKSKMVFLGGPRQVGKTTLAISFLKEGHPEHPAYVNWDLWLDKEKLIRGEIPKEPILIFDEIHKYHNWRNLIKGFYDKYKLKSKFLITGSANLDYYHKGGESLMGRFHYYRLHPFSLNEMNPQCTPSDMETLLKFGGFPEPLFLQNEQSWRRWQRDRLKRVIQDDLQSLENIKEISQIELLLSMLPGRVGSMLSLNSLREFLNCSHASVDKWLLICEHLYLIFRIPPYTYKNERAIKKEKKLYMWDWSVCENEGARFENLVASHLLKYCHFIEDSEGYDMQLHYSRDREGREVDFIVTRDKKIEFAVECKLQDTTRSKHLLYFKERLNIPKCYQVHLGTQDFGDEELDIRVLPFIKFAKELKLV
jgi:predicted AAA+ superfamily ATPase